MKRVLLPLFLTCLFIIPFIGMSQPTDMCDDAPASTSLPGELSCSNPLSPSSFQMAGFTPDSEGTCSSGSPGAWFHFTVDVNNVSSFNIGLTGSPGPTATFSVFTGSSCGGLTPLTVPNGCNVVGSLDILAPAPEYFVFVSESVPTNNLQFAVLAAPAPSNDDCADATLLPSGTPEPGSTLCASQEPGEFTNPFCGGFQNSVWYQVNVPPGSIGFDLQLLGNGAIPTQDGVAMNVFEACNGTEIQPFGASHDCDPINTSTPVYNYICNGTGDFWIRVATDVDDAGDFEILMNTITTPEPIDNDVCADASVLIAASPLVGESNVCAGDDFDFVGACAASSYEAAVWYDYIVPAGIQSIDITVDNWATFPVSSGTVATEVSIMAFSDCAGTLYNAMAESCSPGNVANTLNIACPVENDVIHIQISSATVGQGTFDIEIEEIPFPTSPTCGFNETCSTAEDINSLAAFDPTLTCVYQQIAGCSTDACPESNTEAMGLCTEAEMFATVWHEITIPDGTPDITNLDVMITGATFTAGFSVLEGPCGGPYTALTNAAGDNSACVTAAEITGLDIVEGATYYIAVTDVGGGTGGTYTLEVSLIASPVNDLCDDAIDLNAEGLSYTGSTLCAAPDLAIPACAPSDESQVWFTYTTPVDLLHATINVINGTATGDYAMEIGILIGCDPNSFDSALDAPECGGPNVRASQVCLLEETTYWIAVSNASVEAGEFTISVVEVLEMGCTINNDCDDAEDLTPLLDVVTFQCEYQPFPGCNLDACPDPNVFTACGADDNPVVWHTVIVPADATVMNVQVNGSTLTDPVLSVFTGGLANCDNIAPTYNPVPNGDCITGNQTPIENIAVQPGDEFLIAVGTQGSMGGNYDLEILFVILPENDDPCPTAANPPIDLSGGGSHGGTTCCALGDNDAPLPTGSTEWPNNPDCSSVTADDAVWYMYSPDLSQDGVQIDVTAGSIMGNVTVEAYIGGATAGCDGSWDIAEFSCATLPAQLIVGCFETDDVLWVKVSSQELDAAGNMLCGTFDITMVDIESCDFADECDEITAAQVMMPITDITGVVEYNSCASGCLELACPQDDVMDCPGFMDNPTVWFEIQTDLLAEQLYVEVLPNGLWDAEFAIYQGDCTSLSLVSGGTVAEPINCNTDDSTPEVSNIGVPTDAMGNPVQTFYVAVSGNVMPGDNPTFEICSAATIGIVACIGGIPPDYEDHTCNPVAMFEVTDRDNDPDGSLGLPLEGPFCSGETVTICVDFFYDASVTGNDWLHGIVPNFGTGWDMTTFDPAAITVSPGGAQWFGEGVPVVQEDVPNLCEYTNSDGILVLCNTLCESCPCNGPLMAQTPLPGGWFWVTPGGAGCANTGLPQDGYGIVGGNTVQVNFCFDLTVKEFANETQCLAEGDLRISLQTFSDGVSGCWNDPVSECRKDVNQVVNFPIECNQPPELVATPQPLVICNDGFTNITISTIDLSTASEITVTFIDNPDVTGENNYFFTGGSGLVNDFLTNTSTVPQVVVYEATSTVPGLICPGPTITFEVTVNPQIEVSGMEEVCRESDPALAVTPVLVANALYGTGNYVSYVWQPLNGAPVGNSLNANGNNYEIQQPIPPGMYEYNVIVTDDNVPTACTGEGIVTLEVFPEVEILFDPILDCLNAEDNPVIIPIPQSGTSPYNYAYDVVPSFGALAGNQVGDNFEIDLANTMVNGLPMSVDVSISDLNGCTFETNVPVVINVPLNIDPSVTTVCGAGSATIEALAISVVPGVFPLGLEIFDPSGTSIASQSGNSISTNVTTEGTYTIVAYNPENPNDPFADTCPATLEVEVVFISIDQPTITGPTEICNGESATLSVANAIDYTSFSWDDPSFSTGSSVIVSPTTTTAYNVQVMNSDGCETSEPWIVVVNPSPSIPAGSTVGFCTGTTTTISAGGDPTTMIYAWSGGAFTVNATDPSAIDITTAGVYTVTVTDNVSLCTNTATYTTEAGAMQTVLIQGNNLCDNNPVALTAAVGLTSYTWTYDDGSGPVSAPGANGTNILIATLPGIYGVTGTIGGCDGVGSITITQETTPALPAAMTATVCDRTPGDFPTSIDFNALFNPTGISGTWANTDGALVTLANLADVDFTGVAAGVYDFTFTTNTAAAPCTNPSVVMTVTVNDCACPNPNTNAPMNMCNVSGILVLNNLETVNTDPGTWTIVNAPAGATVDITDGVFESAMQPAGDYELLFTLTNPGGSSCIDTSTQTLTVFAVPIATVTPMVTACNVASPQGETFVDFTLLVSGEAGVWTFVSGPAAQVVDISDLTNVSFDGLMEGVYQFLYTTNTAMAPCTNPSYPLTVTVFDCSCPINDTSAPPSTLCNDSDMLDLSTLVLAPTGAGDWSIVDGPVGHTVTLTGTSFDATDALAGDYTVAYTLNPPPSPNCLPSEEIITVVAAPVLTLTPNASVCSSILQPDPTSLDLIALITDGPTGGTWVDVTGCGLDFTDPTNVSFIDVPSGICVIEYTTPDDGICTPLTATVSVTVSDCLCPNPNTVPGGPFCNTGSLAISLTTLQDANADPGTWSFVSGPETVTITNNFFDPNELMAGDYVVQFTLDTPSPDPTCINFTQQTLTVFEPMNPGIPEAPAQVCLNETVVITLADLLTGEDTGGMWIETSIDGSTGNAFNATAGTFTTTTQLSGTYSFTYGIIDAGPCDDVEATVQVVIEGLPNANAGADQLLDCVTSVVTIGGTSSSGPDIVYSWTEASGIIVPNANQATSSVTESGTYILLVTDNSTGCTATDQVSVNVSNDQPQFTIVAEDPACFGVDDGTITITPLSGGSGNNEYSIDNGATWQTGLIFSGLAGGNYSILVRDDVGCGNMASTTLIAPNALTLELSSEDGLLQLGEPGLLYLDLSIDETQISQFVLTENENILNVSYADTILVTPSEQLNIYNVTITDLNGCIVSDQISIQTTRVIDVYVPNIFSPNSDGTNDKFNIQTNEGLTVAKMSIYDRWGELVYSGSGFKNNDLTQGWDGTFRGEPVELGVYVYVIEVIFDFDGSTESIEGDVTVMR